MWFVLVVLPYLAVHHVGCAPQTETSDRNSAEVVLLLFYNIL